MGILKLQHMG
uniref:Uncharacterized protein n=1 Tax=Rhizophora mucronata TaxID=61149 RepID=A0A2P2QE29_RHIMU